MMEIYKHILLAIDLTEEQRHIEDKAAEIQLLTKARLSVIHVIEPLPMVYTGGEFGVIPEYIETDSALQETATTMLKPVAERLKISADDIVTVTGSVSNEILNYAQEQDVDLIVVGSHGRHGIQLVMGSTANAILHHAHCDVLSVYLNHS